MVPIVRISSTQLGYNHGEGGGRKMVMKEIFCFFVILAILMSTVPISIFGMETDYRREIVS